MTPPPRAPLRGETVTYIERDVHTDDSVELAAIVAHVWPTDDGGIPHVVNLRVIARDGGAYKVTNVWHSDDPSAPVNTWRFP